MSSTKSRVFVPNIFQEIDGKGLQSSRAVPMGKVYIVVLPITRAKCFTDRRYSREVAIRVPRLLLPVVLYSFLYKKWTV